MSKYILILLMLFSAGMLHAQYNGFTQVNDLARFNAEFATAARNTNTIKSDFIQEKNLAMLSEKIVSKGKFWFKKESKVRMEYNHPFSYTMVINNDKVYIKDGQKENTISTKSNRIFQQIIKITVDCVQGTAIQNKDFKTRVFENKSSYLVELSPVTRTIREYFNKIKILVDKKDYSVTQVEMVELSEDNTIIRFINREHNENIPESLFAIK